MRRPGQRLKAGVVFVVPWWFNPSFAPMLRCRAMKHPLYRPLQLVPVCVLGSVLIGEPPALYLWAETDAHPWGDEAVRAILGLGAAVLLFMLTRAEDRALAEERPGWKRPGPLRTAVAIIVVCFLALVLFHLGW